MSLSAFIDRYFYGWGCAVVTMCGNSHGYVKLRNNGVGIKIFFNLNGARYWTDHDVTVMRIEGCNESDF